MTMTRARMQSKMQIGRRSEVRSTKGTLRVVYDFDSREVPCQHVIRRVSQGFDERGNQINVDAVCNFMASETGLSIATSTGAGDRQRVKVDGIEYEVLQVVDVGLLGRIKQAALKRVT